MDKKGALLKIMTNAKRWLGAMTNENAKQAMIHAKYAERRSAAGWGVVEEAMHFSGYIRKLGKSKRREQVLEDLAAAFAMEDAPDETV